MKSPFGPGTPEGTRVDAGPGRGEVMIREAGEQTGFLFFFPGHKRRILELVSARAKGRLLPKIDLGAE